MYFHYQLSILIYAMTIKYRPLKSTAHRIAIIFIIVQAIGLAMGIFPIIAFFGNKETWKKPIGIAHGLYTMYLY